MIQQSWLQSTLHFIGQRSWTQSRWILKTCCLTSYIITRWNKIPSSRWKQSPQVFIKKNYLEERKKLCLRTEYKQTCHNVYTIRTKLLNFCINQIRLAVPSFLCNTKISSQSKLYYLHQVMRGLKFYKGKGHQHNHKTIFCWSVKWWELKKSVYWHMSLFYHVLRSGCCITMSLLTLHRWETIIFI